ncbi:YihY family inner membrane protein [Bordetella sp. 02P26C-1]|uniref:YihY family inner membrane protein n=1 Tax=Bordetella sp. 02P26C-1 TaxID=2683195 RepID=UPI001355D0F6|nr:YihY family inner membrane protein [Bordetella sp. 02P26C-1]MVW80447.1 YihY family inner membrane protein [Bordetella sp. 02P26C-1]
MSRIAEPPAATQPAATATPHTRRWSRAGKMLQFAAHRAAEERLLQVASALTFTTVLGLVPMLAVVLSLFTAFPVFQEFRLALDHFLETSLMPPSVSDNIMNYLNQFARQATRLTTIGGGFLIVTSILLIMTIDKSFNDIWHVTRQRPLPQRALIYWAVITLGPVVAGASLWATSYVARESMGLVRDVPEIMSAILYIVPVVLTGLGFAALFVVVPNRKVVWRDALAGGFATAVVLELMKVAFAYYVARFPTYTVLYGAFATLPIFLLWIYLSWLAVLCGATMAANLPLIRMGRWEIQRQPGAVYIDAIAVLRALNRAQGHRPAGKRASTLARRLHLHQDELNLVLERLEDMGLVARTAEDRWVLACDPRKISLAPVVDHFLIDRAQPRLREQPQIIEIAAATLAGAPAPSLDQLERAGPTKEMATDAQPTPLANTPIKSGPPPPGEASC